MLRYFRNRNFPHPQDPFSTPTVFEELYEVGYKNRAVRTVYGGVTEAGVLIVFYDNRFRPRLPLVSANRIYQGSTVRGDNSAFPTGVAGGKGILYGKEVLV